MVKIRAGQLSKNKALFKAKSWAKTSAHSGKGLDAHEKPGSVERVYSFALKNGRLRLRLSPKTAKSMISVVIVNWNSKAYVRTCLASLYARCKAEFEVVVVDNASFDGCDVCL